MQGKIYKGQKKEEEMGIKNLSKDALLVELPSKSPKIAAQLKAVNATVSKNGSCDVIIDFSRVEIINSANISNLLILHNMLQNSDHRLIFCNVATVTKCIFVVAGLNDIFEFVDDRSKAMATVGQAG
jgi:anti-anti-sigma regulatory factor